MAQYKVRIVFEATLHAGIDDEAERQALGLLRDMVDHVQENGSTHVLERAPRKTVEFSIESETWNT